MARDQITRKMVDRQFELFCKTVPAPEGKKWALERRTPGGGFAYYVLGMTGTDGDTRFYNYQNPMGVSGWRGARAAFDGLHAMWRMADYLKANKPNRDQVIELMTAAAILRSHAEERHPHFESERGRQDIERVVKACNACEDALHS